MASIRVTGSQESLAAIRELLKADSSTEQLEVTDPTKMDSELSVKPQRVRDFGIGEAIFAIMIHIPAGIASHALYDCVHGWLKNRTDQMQIRVEKDDSAEK